MRDALRHFSRLDTLLVALFAVTAATTATSTYAAEQANVPAASKTTEMRSGTATSNTPIVRYYSGYYGGHPYSRYYGDVSETSGSQVAGISVRPSAQLPK